MGMHRNVQKASVLLTIFACIAAGGCSYKYMVINSSFVMVEESMASFFEETDTVLAAQAAPANLKLIEGMARGNPRNLDIQMAASQLIAMYAFGFLEDCCTDEDEQDIANERARHLYLRAREYAVRVLDDHEDFSAIMEMDLQSFEIALQNYDEDHIDPLFWTALSWGLYINLSRHDVAAVADMSKVAALARRVIQLDPTHFYGGAHMFLMVFHGTLGPALGGNPDEAKAEYERAWQAGDKSYLMTKYMFAKTYCQQTLNRELFEQVLGEIIDAPDDLLPEQGLANQLAKEKAARLLNQADEIF